MVNYKIKRLITIRIFFHRLYLFLVSTILVQLYKLFRILYEYTGYGNFRKIAEVDKFFGFQLENNVSENTVNNQLFRYLGR